MDSGPRVSRGMGSGFIISKEGYILTNEHVISGAQKIEVIINGKDKPVPAKLVGSDFELDLAVLKINSEGDLSTLELGDSDAVRVGEWAIAIGNPQGLDHTVTGRFRYRTGTTKTFFRQMLPSIPGTAAGLF